MAWRNSTFDLPAGAFLLSLFFSFFLFASSFRADRRSFSVFPRTSDEEIFHPSRNGSLGGTLNS